MIVIFFGLVGAILGARNAHKRHGNRKDIAQYAAATSIVFMLIGLIITVLVDRFYFAA